MLDFHSFYTRCLMAITRWMANTCFDATELFWLPQGVKNYIYRDCYNCLIFYKTINVYLSDRTSYLLEDVTKIRLLWIIQTRTKYLLTLSNNFHLVLLQKKFPVHWKAGRKALCNRLEKKKQPLINVILQFTYLWNRNYVEDIGIFAHRQRYFS